MFLRMKMSPVVDAVIMVCMFVANRIALAYGSSLFGAVLIVFVALFIELGLSMARAIELEVTFRLWKMRKEEAETLRKEVNRLNKIVRRQSLARRHPSSSRKSKG